jgi:hypothetical protein
MTDAEFTEWAVRNGRHGNHMDEFRPEYSQAIDAARWNFWWYIAAAIPLLLFIPAAAKRQLGCLAFPLAYTLSWIAMCAAVEYYWAAKKSNAVTEAEWNDVIADTARVFAPATVIPFVVVYVSVVGAVVYGLFAIVRRIRNETCHNE